MRIHLYFVTFVAALGGLMFGFETGIINGTVLYVHLNGGRYTVDVTSNPV